MRIATRWAGWRPSSTATSWARVTRARARRRSWSDARRNGDSGCRATGLRAWTEARAPPGPVVGRVGGDERKLWFHPTGVSVEGDDGRGKVNRPKGVGPEGLASRLPPSNRHCRALGRRAAGPSAGRPPPGQRPPDEHADRHGDRGPGEDERKDPHAGDVTDRPWPSLRPESIASWPPDVPPARSIASLSRSRSHATYPTSPAESNFRVARVVASRWTETRLAT